MPRLVLADTSGLFASLDADDPHHLQARSFLAGRSATYIVADTIFAETMTLVKIPLGASLAINLGREILAGAPFRFHRLTDDEQAETWSIFSRSTDKERNGALLTAPSWPSQGDLTWMRYLLSTTISIKWPI